MFRERWTVVGSVGLCLGSAGLFREPWSVIREPWSVFWERWAVLGSAGLCLGSPGVCLQLVAWGSDDAASWSPAGGIFGALCHKL